MCPSSSPPKTASPSSKGVSGAKPQSRIFAYFLGESKKYGRRQACRGKNQALTKKMTRKQKAGKMKTSSSQPHL